MCLNDFLKLSGAKLKEPRSVEQRGFRCYCQKSIACLMKWHMVPERMKTELER